MNKKKSIFYIICIVTLLVTTCLTILSPLNMETVEAAVMEEPVKTEETESTDANGNSSNKNSSDTISNNSASEERVPSSSSSSEGNTDNIDAESVSTQLAKPTHLRWESINGSQTLATWDEVVGASSYKVSYGFHYSNNTSSTTSSGLNVPTNSINLKNEIDRYYDVISNPESITSILFYVQAISTTSNVESSDLSTSPNNTEYRPSGQTPLDIPDGLAWTGDDGTTAYWNSVPNASYYEIQVVRKYNSSPTTISTSSQLFTTTENSYPLKNTIDSIMDREDGITGVAFKVRARTSDYETYKSSTWSNDSEPSSYHGYVGTTQLSAPTNLRWGGDHKTILYWDPVENASRYSYSVKINTSKSTSSVTSGLNASTDKTFVDLTEEINSNLSRNNELYGSITGITFRVRANSPDISQYRTSPWSEYSADSGYRGEGVPNSTIVFPEITAVSNLVYNGTSQSLVTPPTASTIPTGYKIQYVLGKDDTTAPETGFADTVPSAIKAGSYYVWYKYVGIDSTYADSSAKSVVATIAKKPATITASAQTVGKGDVLSQKTDLAAASGLITGDSIYSITFSLIESASTSTVGTFPSVIKPSGAIIASAEKADVTSCYEITYNNGNLTVDDKPVAKNELVYNGTDQALITAGPSGYVYSTTEAGTYSKTIPTGKDEGDYTIYYKASSTATTATKLSAKIDKRQITVTTKPMTKVYGEKDPSFSDLANTLTYPEGALVGTDTITDVVSGILGRTAGEDVGKYEITGDKLKTKNSNYSVMFKKGEFTITKATLDTTKLDLTKEYKIPTVKTTGWKINISSLLMDGAQKISITPASTLQSILTNPDLSGTNLVMDVAANTAGTTGTVELKLSCKNYNDYTVTLNLISAGHIADVHLETAETGAVTNVTGVDATGLSEYASGLTGESVDVDMTITPKAEASVNPQTAVTQFKSQVSSYYSGFDSTKLVTEYLDISVKKTTTDSTGTKTENVTELDKPVAVELSFDLTGKYLPIVLREHDGKTVKFTQVYSPLTTYKDGYYYISGYKGNVTIYIYSKSFSTYGIAYTTNPAYTITYDTGSSEKTVIAEAGSYLDKPTNPTRSGYTFKGWYDEDEKWHFSNESEPDSVYGDMTLTAKWSKKSSGSNDGNNNGSGDSNSSNNSSSGSSSSSSSNSNSSTAQPTSAGSARPAFTGNAVQTSDEMPSVMVWVFIMLFGIGITVFASVMAYQSKDI